MIPLPSFSKTRWVYDDPSGLPEARPAALRATQRAKAKILRLPLPFRHAPATPKAA